MKNILIISASLNENSSNRKIVYFLINSFKEEYRFKYSIPLNELPHFDPSISITPAVTELIADIHKADAVLISSPEYVFSMPAILKNALEWCVSGTVFTDKPVGIIVGAASGQKCMEHLVMVLETLQAKLSIESQLIISGVKGKIDQLGGKQNTKLKEDLEIAMLALLKSIS
jgi:chromate reductase, NAD(P)H dehydrogenase (quinone)